MPCVKLQRTIYVGSPQHSLVIVECCLDSGKEVAEGLFPLAGQTVITDPRYLMSGASRWELSREKTHSAGLSHSARVCERERGNGEKVRDTRYQSARENGSENCLRACFHCICESACVCVFLFFVFVPLTKKLAYPPKPWDWRWPHLWKAPINSLQVMMVDVWSKAGTGLAFGLLVQLEDISETVHGGMIYWPQRDTPCWETPY